MCFRVGTYIALFVILDILFRVFDSFVIVKEIESAFDFKNPKIHPSSLCISNLESRSFVFVIGFSTDEVVILFVYFFSETNRFFG